MPSPYAGREILACVRASGGTAVAVSDDELLAATRRLAREEGLLVAPEAGATLAAAAELAGRGEIERDETVVLFLTGSALTYLDVMGDR